MAAKSPLVLSGGIVAQVPAGDTIVLPDGSTATTATAQDASTKVATTAYADRAARETFALTFLLMGA